MLLVARQPGYFFLGYLWLGHWARRDGFFDGCPSSSRGCWGPRLGLPALGAGGSRPQLAPARPGKQLLGRPGHAHGGLLHRAAGQPQGTTSLAHMHTQMHWGCLIMEKIIITITLINIEIRMIQTIIFEFENMMYLFIMSLPNNTL